SNCVLMLSNHNDPRDYSGVAFSSSLVRRHPAARAEGLNSGIRQQCGDIVMASWSGLSIKTI
ncbi:MAG: hypothetical protein ACTHZ1_05565, partial [Sphingobacterium sp.]